jgi:hypothetical protein
MWWEIGALALALYAIWLRWLDDRDGGQLSALCSVLARRRARIKALSPNPM